MVLPIKRGRSDSTTLVDADRKVLELINSKESNGISRPQIKYGTQLADPVITKSIDSLKVQNLIKEVIDVRNLRSKHYMGVQFRPSPEVSGGEWYVDGRLDVEFITMLRRLCLKHISEVKVSTIERTTDFICRLKVFNTSISLQQIQQILKLMVLDDEVEEVTSTGRGEFSSVPVGKVCYRKSFGTLLKNSAMSKIPCGVCPQISKCTPDGIISPNKCVYYKKWLEF